MARKKTPKIQTVRPSRRGIAYNIEVLNWVQNLTSKGLSTKRIVRRSHDGDYPYPRQALSDGALNGIRPVIYHLENQGVGFPLEANGTSIRQKPGIGKRVHVMGQKRAAARRRGESMAFWDTAYETTKSLGLLQSLELADVELDEQNLDTISDLLEILLYQADWTDRQLLAIEGRLGEHRVLGTIEKLRRMTVERGCSPEEAENAHRAADRLEAQLRKKLNA